MKILKEPSNITLVVSNIITIVIALAQDWSLINLLWVYWAQSVIIGIFNALRMFADKKEWQSSLFFCLHYGFFHLLYFFFLAIFASEGFFQEFTPVYCIIPVLTFLVNHLYSYFRHRNEKHSFQRLFFFPYARIVPMHLIVVTGTMIAAGYGNKAVLLLFMVLKTIVDLIMHIIEHR